MVAWSVFFEYRQPPDEEGGLDPTRLDELLDRLRPYAGSVGGDSSSYSARFCVEADSLSRAIEVGQRTLIAFAVEVGLPDWDAVECTAVRWDRFEELNPLALPHISG